MTKIDSGNARFEKKVGPFAWVGIAVMFFLVEIHSRVPSDDAFLYVAPVVMAVVGYFGTTYSARKLVDEVYDTGDCLLVKNDGQEDLIRLSDIMNVNISAGGNSTRISLRLATPGKFGSEICFSPVTEFTLNPFAKNKIGEDLINRVHEARQAPEARIK